MNNSFEKRFSRLLDAVLDGRVVPFVGAGFSRNAQSDKDEKFDPNASGLIEKLFDLINENCSSSKPKTDIAAESVKVLLKAARESRTPSLGQLAEIAQWLTGNSQKVLRHLEIDLFDTLLPSHAHRYLAYLVREGLVNEVITTNYDVCLEKAYCRSFGKLCKKTNKDYVGVVHNVHTYRKHGARVYTEDRKGYPVLLVYKINGCATEYADNNKSSHNNTEVRILLTERELQDFDREVWARDLLRDRARRRALMFVGFGSEEPQVRHTVLALMEEFHQEGRHGGKDSTKEILNRPNAPFLIAHKDTLSFTQLQIMAGFIEAHRPEEHTHCLLDHYFGNVLSGCDCASLDIDNSKKAGLGADEFMQRLFQAVFGRLLARYSSQGFSFYKWLDEHTGIPGKWRDTLINGMYPMPSGKNTDENDTKLQYFGRWPQLLWPSPTDRFGPCLLWQWLRIIQREGTTVGVDDCPPDYYLALRDDSLLILIFLTLLTALAEKSAIRLRSVVGIGVELCCTSWNQPLFLAHNQRQIRMEQIKGSGEAWKADKQKMELVENNADHTPLPRLLRILDLTSETYLEPEGLLHAEPPNNPDKPTTIRISRYIRVPAADWLREARSPDRLGESLDKIFDRFNPKNRKTRIRMTRLADDRSEEG